jgi:hypothetical protein
MKDVVHEAYRVKRRPAVRQLSLFDAVCPIEDLTVSIEWDGCSSATNGKPGQKASAHYHGCEMRMTKYEGEHHDARNCD